MRAFLAIELPSAMRDALGEEQRALAAHLDGWRWTPRERIHLTLRFLGEIADDAIACAAGYWRDAASRVDPIVVRVAGLGVFPSARRPRVLWAGVAEEPQAGRLDELVRGIERGCRAAALPAEERPFRPHLTLARARGATAEAPPLGATLDCGIAAFVEVVAFRSELLPRGAVHTPLLRLSLGGGAR